MRLSTGWQLKSVLADHEDQRSSNNRMATMTERITRSSVTFLHDFILRDLDGVQAPGTYLIETVEEPLETLSFLAYRRVATTIALPAIGVVSRRRQVITIDPAELQAALARDASGTPAGDGEPRRS